MDLDKQLKALEASKQWSKIIHSLEKIKQIDRTPKQNLMLANAYVNSSLGDWTKRKNFQKAARLLNFVKDKFGKNANWNVLMGNACYFLNQWSRAWKKNLKKQLNTL